METPSAGWPVNSEDPVCEQVTITDEGYQLDMPKLLIRSSETGEFRHLSITDGEVISVGRYNTNDLCLPHRSVSNFHALIICVDGGVTMKDLKSMNGTRVNGESIQMQVLGHLDDISIGTYTISYSDNGIESPQLARDETSTATVQASDSETETVESEAAKPEAVESEAGKPEAGKPEAVESEAGESEAGATQLPPLMRKNWIAIQKKFDYPVNAIGLKIQPSDTKAMQVWKREKIDMDGRLSCEP